MRKLFFTAILLFGFAQVSWSQDSTDFFDSSWNSYENLYRENTIDKPVTPQDYQKALETVQSLQKKKKDKKAKKKKKKSREIDAIDQPPPDQPKVAPTLPPSPNPLLRLPVSVYYKDNVIVDGYYLISPVNKGEDYYLRFNQGYKNVAEVEANIVNDPVRIPSEFGVFIEFMDADIIKILYRGYGMVLESELPIFK